MSNNNSDIDNYQNKIKANILKIEKVIKKFRHTRETNLTTYYATNENKPSRMDKEIKWNNLSLKNKQYLVNNLKNVNQNNISIICDLENWKTKHNKKINLDAIYNMCIYYIVDRVLSNKIDKNEIKNDDEIIIKIYIDQRKDIPKISSKKQYKLRGLEDYLNTQFYLNSSYENLKSIRINQLNSNYQPLIRYADYYVGLIGSYCRLLSKLGKEYDEQADILFDNMHARISCECMWTIKNQSTIAQKVVSCCQKVKLDKNNTKKCILK